MKTNSVTLFLPLSRANDGLLIRMLNDLTELVGGCTIVPARGKWIDRDKTEHVDPLSLYVWWHEGDGGELGAVYKAANEIALYLLRAGEKSIAFETRESNRGGQFTAMHFIDMGTNQLSHSRLPPPDPMFSL